MKTNTRKRLALLRSSLENEDFLKCGETIKNNLFNLEEYQNAKTVLFYYSFGSEVPTQKMIQESLKEKIVLLPKIIAKEKSLVACEIKDCDKDLMHGFHDIKEPKSDCKRYTKDEIDLIIVPGIGFGENGERLGYGSGFYDRFLKGCTGTFVGICFELQLTDKIIPEKHDVKMHKIVTEKRVIDCKI